MQWKIHPIRLHDCKKIMSNDFPLRGVIACLSGLPQDRKEEIHGLILSMGGRYTRELNLDKNTHLITEKAKGAKYELAVSSNPPVHVVSSSWVISTFNAGKRASEAEHGLNPTANDSVEIPTRTTHRSNHSLISLADTALLEDVYSNKEFKVGCAFYHSRSVLFEKLQFYLIGFEDNPELKQKLSKLIRRGSGTIYWDMNKDISVLLVCDACDKALQKAARIIANHHSNFPPIVSPLWVLDTYKQSTLLPASAYPPAAGHPLNSTCKQSRMNSSKKSGKDLSRTSSLSSTTSNFSIFRKCIFSLVRSSSLDELDRSQTPSTNIEFDQSEVEASIKAHGGQILSVKLLDALRADAQNRDRSTSSATAKRKCHVVCWGESPPRLDTNPLVSQLQRHDICELILVTPIWVQTCVSVRKRIRPECLPLGLTPQSWPMKSAFNVVFQKQQSGGKQGGKIENRNSNHRLRRPGISLTGFQGTEKAAIVELIDLMGGVYHDNMSNVNTHLVFKKNATGLKLEKANEWGLHVVPIQWLFHVLEHGYGGVHNDRFGCEKRFSNGVAS